MLRSLCSTLVGMPVDGPPRWTSMTMSGISAITAQPMASPLSEMPGPEDPVTATRPPQLEPMAIETAAISSSHWTKIPSYLGSSRRSSSMMSDHGVMG